MKPLRELKTPSTAILQEYAVKFDEERCRRIEDLMRDYATQEFDWSINGIYMSVILVNQLFGTNLRNPFAMAKHIFDYREALRPMIESGDAEAVGIIAIGHGISNRRECKESVLYSFATKFCRWLNPADYPIFDRHVENLLRLYDKEYDIFPKKVNLRNYKTFKSCIDLFMQRFNLVCTYRELDKFLWFYSSQEVFNKK